MLPDPAPKEIAVISVSSAIVGICILALMAYLLCRYLKMKDKDFSLKESMSNAVHSVKDRVKVAAILVFESCARCFGKKVGEEKQKGDEKGEVGNEDKSDSKVVSSAEPDLDPVVVNAKKIISEAFNGMKEVNNESCENAKKRNNEYCENAKKINDESRDYLNRRFDNLIVLIQTKDLQERSQNDNKMGNNSI